jgi:carbamoyltransferase
MTDSSDILGISCYYHDAAACLVRNGEIVAAASEERFTRKKHDADFPRQAIEYCLAEGGIEAAELDHVAFYDKPFLKFERILETYLAYAPQGLPSFLKSMPLWMKRKLWIPDLIRKALPGFDGELVFPEHHESHAASAFFPSPFQRAAFLTIDGVGEWATTSFGVGRDNEVHIHSEIHFPHSLGLLYSAFTYYTGFRVNSGEYKVMGLAPYGEPRYVDLILDELIDLKADGSFRLNMRYFDYGAGLRMTSRRFHDLFGGPPRKPESDLTRREMDLARSVQVVTEEIMLRMARHVHAETGESRLCLAGGVALNCVGNGRLLREGPFDDIWIQPAAGDAGGALGAALLTWHQVLEQPRQAAPRGNQGGSYLGPSFSGEEIEEVLREQDAVWTTVPWEELPRRTAELIADEKVIGWFQGRMEFGPRALGSRSIIGDARSRDMQTVMNLKIKYRESFRPFAPTVLADDISAWFEIDRESPYMLLVAQVHGDHLREPADEDRARTGLELLKVDRSSVPAITHVDNSARIQSVHRDDNPLYYDTIAAFRDLTGCPVIINTSFNVRGEPIVRSPLEAYTCFMRTDMDYLVLGNHLLDKRDQPTWAEVDDWRQEFVLD